MGACVLALSSGATRILNCFLNDVVKPTGQLSDHILCFGFLVEIVDHLRMGSEGAALHVDRLTRLIDLHNQLFILLYEHGVKSKFHHLHHIVDHINWIGKCLSCFVTERKHRSSKSSALYMCSDLWNRLFFTIRSTNAASRCSMLTHHSSGVQIC